MSHHRCQNLTPNGRQCRRRAFRDGELCRYHRIAKEFSSDLQQRGRVVPPLLLVGAIFTTKEAYRAFDHYFQGESIIWLAFGTFALGWGLALLADSMMARRLPAARWIVWPRLLELGLIAVVAGGMATHNLVMSERVSSPEQTATAIQALVGRGDPQLAMSLTASAAVVTSAIMGLMLIRRIWYFRAPHLGVAAVWPATVFAVVSAFRDPEAVARSQPLVTIPTLDYEVFGTGTIGIAGFIGFAVCEVINARMRNMQLDREGFQQTIWPSYPVCAGVPGLAIVASMLGLSAVGIDSAVALVAMSAVASGVLCHHITRVLINRYHDRARRAREAQRRLQQRRAGRAPIIDAEYWIVDDRREVSERPQ